jgi:hypothetical protein
VSKISRLQKLQPPLDWQVSVPANMSPANQVSPMSLHLRITESKISGIRLAFWIMNMKFVPLTLVHRKSYYLLKKARGGEFGVKRLLFSELFI